MKPKIHAVTGFAIRLRIILFIFRASCINLKFFISAPGTETSDYFRTGGFPLFLPRCRSNIRYLVIDSIIRPGEIADGNILGKSYQ